MQLKNRKIVFIVEVKNLRGLKHLHVTNFYLKLFLEILIFQKNLNKIKLIDAKIEFYRTVLGSINFMQKKFSNIWTT